MKILSLEEIDQGMLRVKVQRRKYSGWKFWNNAVVLETYIGNITGWYNIDTGELLTKGQVKYTLDNVGRKHEINKLLVKHDRSKIKPVK